MFTPETRQTDSNTVTLTEPLYCEITCWWCGYVLYIISLNDVLVTRN